MHTAYCFTYYFIKVCSILYVYSQIFRWYAHCVISHTIIKVVCNVPCIFRRFRCYAYCILFYILFYKNSTQYIMHIQKYFDTHCILFHILFYKNTRHCIHVEKVVCMHTACWVCLSLIPSIAAVACGSLPKTLFHRPTQNLHTFLTFSAVG